MRLVLQRVIEIALLGGHDLGIRAIVEPLEDLALAVHQRAGGEAEKPHARPEELVKERPVGIEERLAAVEIARGEAGFLQQGAALRLAKQAGGFRRRVDEAAHVLHEGRIERTLERHRADDRDEDGGRRRDDRKKADDAGMKPRAGLTAAKGGPERPALGDEEPEEQKDDRHIGEEQRQHDVVCRDDGRIAGEDEQRYEADGRGEDHGHRADAGQQAPARRARRPGILGVRRLRHRLNSSSRNAARGSTPTGGTRLSGIVDPQSFNVVGRLARRSGPERLGRTTRARPK